MWMLPGLAKSWLRGERTECHTCVRTRSPRGARSSGVKSAGARHAREWFAKIQPLALQGSQLSFAIFIFGYLTVKQECLSDRNQIRI
jgi:hypothetical protein